VVGCNKLRNMPRIPGKTLLIGFKAGWRTQYGDRILKRAEAKVFTAVWRL